jgi:hypothetical protein
MSDEFKPQELKLKTPDYLIQYRNGLWVAIREKEGNVWKFVTFYVTAISLIIGLGQKLVTSTDFTIDVSVTAAIIGLLTFWGLAIVIDSNSWMSRNLKLIGNIEKLFIPRDEFDRFIPGYYSSPLFRYFRPYTVDFFFLLILAVIAYLNLLIRFPADQSWRAHLLPVLTAIYGLGFHAIQGMDDSARQEYFRFYKNAPGETLKDDNGKPAPIGSERFPTEYLEFKVATAAKFQAWPLVGCSVVLISYAAREGLVNQRSYARSFIVFASLVVFAYLIVSRWLRNHLEKFENQAVTPSDWTMVREYKLTRILTTGAAKEWYVVFTVICKWLLLLGVLIVTTWPYRHKLWEFLGVG